MCRLEMTPTPAPSWKPQISLTFELFWLKPLNVEKLFLSQILWAKERACSCGQVWRMCPEQRECTHGKQINKNGPRGVHQPGHLVGIKTTHTPTKVSGRLMKWEVCGIIKTEAKAMGTQRYGDSLSNRMGNYYSFNTLQWSKSPCQSPRETREKEWPVR